MLLLHFRPKVSTLHHWHAASPLSTRSKYSPPLGCSFISEMKYIPFTDMLFLFFLPKVDTSIPDSCVSLFSFYQREAYPIHWHAVSPLSAKGESIPDSPLLACCFSPFYQRGVNSRLSTTGMLFLPFLPKGSQIQTMHYWHAASALLAKALSLLRLCP